MTDLRVEPLKAYAVITPKKPRAGFDARISAGSTYRCEIYWTRSKAKAACEEIGGEVVRVVVNQVFP